MTTTLQLTHTDTGNSTALEVQVWQADAHPPEQFSPVAEHRLAPGETIHLTVTDSQRIVVIEPRPTFAQQIAGYRATAPTPKRVATHDDVNRMLADIGSRD